MRIAFVTDIHIGATADGFQMQPRWIEGTPGILVALVRRLQSLAPDLTIIGGDIVERGIRVQIDQAVGFLARLQGRTLVCLGNHDLTEGDSFELWRDALARHERVTLANALIELPGCDVIGLNTLWLSATDAAGLRWTLGEYPRAAAPEAQLRQLDEWLARRSDRPAILAMHSQLNGVPVSICGGEKPFEPPTPSFESAIRAILSRHPRVRVTLSGHCHAACAIERNGRVEVTGTSLTETPYQFQIVELDAGKVRVRTERIVHEGGPAVVSERRWVYENINPIPAASLPV